jgi:Mitochondrial small ribosomal subunit Rsm22
LYRFSSKVAINKPHHFIFSNALNKQSQFDIIILSNVVNELYEQDKLNFLSQLNNSLISNGLIIIIEPALQEITRSLMTLRNSLLQANTDLSMLFPCTHNNSCPMLLASKKDWCHVNLNWEEPNLVKQLDNLTGFNKHRIKFSVCVLQKNGIPTGGLRVVDVPSKNKTGWHNLLCGEKFYGVSSLSKSNRSLANKDFERLSIYDRVEVASEDALPEIDRECKVSKI